MIKNGQRRSVPVVGWQGEEDLAFRVLRLDELRGKKPKDGHDPGVPHRIGFHAMMLVVKGTFDHWIDFRSHRFQRNQLIYIAPNQIHRFVPCAAGYQVWVLIFRPEIFPAGIQQMNGGQAPWSVVSYLWPCITKLKAAQASLILDQLQFLRKMESVGQSKSRESIYHFVRGVIGLAFEFSVGNGNGPVDLAANPRFLEFVQCVEEFFATRRDVKWYADRLDCSQRTLNRACQQTTGESAKTVINHRVIIEAKRLLTQNADSVNFVAESLGFNATTNFVRYFRNETGVTPQVFRDEHTWPSTSESEKA